MDSRKLDAIVPLLTNKMMGRVDDDPDAEDARVVDEMSVDLQASIAVIPVMGSLIRRGTWLDAYSGLQSYGEIADNLDCALNDGRIRAILLQIDSFGGEAGGCFELCDRIYAARAQKPIWAVADIDALSAGYAILSSATRCFVAPRGSCGSIGVVSVHLERSQQNEMAGLTYTVFRAGDRKADFNPYERLAPEAAQKQMISIERVRQTFAETVSRNRNGLAIETIMGTEGQWYDPEDGLELGLVDGVSNYDDVFAELAASIATPSQPPAPPPEPDAPVDPEEEPEELPDDDDNTEKDENEMAIDNKGNKTPPATTVAGAAATGEVVQLDANRSGEKSLAFQVAELCRVAGRPELAAEFIVQEKSLEDVRASLIDLNANKPENATNVSNTPPAGGAGGNPFSPAPNGNALGSWDRHLKAAQATNPQGFPVPARR